MNQIKEGPCKTVLEDGTNNHPALRHRNELVSTTASFLKREAEDGFPYRFCWSSIANSACTLLKTIEKFNFGPYDLHLFTCQWLRFFYP